MVAVHLKFHKENRPGSLFFGFEMYFVHCFGTRVDPLWMITSRELDSPLFVRSSAFTETEGYW